MKKTKIVLDAGHGGRDPGATFRNLKEKDVVFNIVMLTRAVLSVEPMIQVSLTRETDIYVSPTQRARIANGIGADFFVSIHLNADPDDDTDPTKEGLGEEIWVYPNSKKSRQYAEILAPYVDRCFPDEKFRGIKENGRLAVLQKTVMPANLIEVGFIDAVQTNTALRQQHKLNEIAISLSLGIVEVVKQIRRK